MPVPAATAQPIEHADWLELEAIRAADRNSSLQDLASGLRRTGSSEELEDERPIEDRDDALADRGGETTEPVAEAAFAEIEDREIACGGEYPFHLEDGALQGGRTVRTSLYVFLLLLSKFGKDAGPAGLNVPQLFEELSELAVAHSMGGDRNGVQSAQFGFPRRITPAGFADAVDDLCKSMGEGGESKDRPRTQDQKDAGLDVVAWRSFPDGRRGKLMVWAQCATGGGWRDKVYHLQPANWAEAWLKDRPAAVPMPAFFVPHRVNRDDWDLFGIYAGIMFDRCRIAACATPLSRRVRDECRAYNRHVIAEQIRS